MEYIQDKKGHKSCLLSKLWNSQKCAQKIEVHREEEILIFSRSNIRDPGYNLVARDKDMIVVLVHQFKLVDYK